MLKNISLTVLVYFVAVNAYVHGQNWGCKYDASEEVGTNKNARVLAYDPTSVHTIPVMFEIYYRNEAIGTGRNISEQTLIDVLDLVNKRFAAQAPYGGQNANIRFELVKRNGNHEPSNGIKRFNIKNSTEQVQYFSDLQQFGNSKYVTIRLHDAFNPGVDGVASAVLNAMDVRYTLFSNLNEASVVIAHELGHVFSLKHTFQGSIFDSVTNTWSCASSTNDGVSDTDPHKQNDTGCNPSTINSCTGTAFGTLLRNYMCYSGFSCQDQFTPLQIARMRNEIQTNKPELTNTLFLTAPTTAEYPTLPICTVSVPTYSDLGAPNGMGETSFSTDLGGNTYGMSNLNPVIHGAYKNFGRTRLISVTRGNTVQFTAKTWWSEKIKIYLDKDNDGVFNEVTELLHNLDYGTVEQNPIDPLYFYFGFNQIITLPTDALTDTYLRMRIVTIVTAENNTACNLILDPDGYGSVTDYSLYIKDNRPKFTMITKSHPAQSINKGENGAIIYKSLITTGAIGSTINALTLKTSGTYAAGDIASFKMYVNSMNSLTGATFVGSVSSIGGAGETLNFNQYSIPIPANGGTYFIFTADVNANALTGRTIKINGVNNPIGIVTTGTQPVFINNQTDIVGTQTINQANFQITGNVINNNANITGRVYASLIANSSTLKTVEVNNGVFNIGSVFDGAYMIVIHNTPEGSGTPNLPAGMVQWVGENLDNNPNDNLPNGILNITVNGTTISQARVNAVKTVTFRVNNVVSVTSIKTGNWEDPTTWNVGRLPLITEDVTIGSTHTVTITTNNQAKAKKLINSTNATLRLGSTTSKLMLGN